MMVRFNLGYQWDPILINTKNAPLNTGSYCFVVVINNENS